MKIKYTNDGKKVKVISKINSQESVVQEIFIDGKKEIPSGEQFVVKSLHDNPLISWQEKRTKEIDKNLTDMKRKFSAEDERLQKQIYTIKSLTSALKKIEKYCIEDEMKHLESFMSGGVKYILKIDYWEYSIVEFTKEIMDREDNWNPELKLLTLFGRSDGNLTWRLNRYNDGSGSNIEVIPCASIEEAKKEIQRHVDNKIEIKKKIGSAEYKAYKKYGIQIESKFLKEYKQSKIEECKKAIVKNKEKSIKDISKIEKEIKEYELF